MSTTELLSEVRELEDEVHTLKCLIKDFEYLEYLALTSQEITSKLF